MEISGITIEEMEVASVKANKILSLGADKDTVERCKAAAGMHGALAPPVVGTLDDGSKVVLSGECEFAAIREAGARRMPAVSVRAQGADGGAKLALLLSSLRKGPGALCEGMLLREALDGGATCAELGGMLGRSASWLSNRIALAARLDGGVRDMVARGLLDARSAQEVARLPAGEQYVFAENAVREGLPKSAIERLVAGYGDESCPAEAKAQIIRDPRSALARVSDMRRAVRERGPAAGLARAGAPPSSGLARCMADAKAPLSRLAIAMFNAPPAEASPLRVELAALADDLAALLGMARGLLSPGKKEGMRHAAN